MVRPDGGADYPNAADLAAIHTWPGVWPVHPGPIGASNADGPFEKLPNLIEAMSSEERKKYPVKTGVIDYFRDALLRVARVSYEGNEKHNPGTRTHWVRGKSGDHGDCTARHFFCNDDEEHMANTVWRALADLQLYLESKYNLAPPPGARGDD